VANRVTNAFGDNGAEERAIHAANEAVVILDDWRRLKTAAGKATSTRRCSRGAEPRRLRKRPPASGSRLALVRLAVRGRRDAPPDQARQDTIVMM
jgi:hypothetical protein